MWPPDPARPSILDAGDPAAVRYAAGIVRGGGVIVLPTDTVYGIAAALDQPDALARIFRSKGRPDERTLPVLLGSLADLDRVSTEPSARVLRLMRRFWPGPLTIVVCAKPNLPPQVVGLGETVGVRVPADPTARAVLDLCGGALAVTSANPSGSPAALDAITARDTLGDGIDAVLDGGPATGGVASTVVRATGPEIEIIRVGALDPAAILAVWATDVS